MLKVSSRLLKGIFQPTEKPQLSSRFVTMPSHALQLYDLQSALRLIATYDLPQQATQGIVLRIQKSCNSLAVIRQLDEFASSPVELRALERYRIGVEESLQTVLK